MISRRRQKLHALIATFTDTTGSWEREEREISAKRRALHRQIDQLLDRTDNTRKSEPASADVSARTGGHSAADVPT